MDKPLRFLFALHIFSEEREMSEEPIQRYSFGVQEVAIYADRIELGLPRKSYYFGEIQRAELSMPLLIQKTFRLILTDGTRSKPVYLTPRVAEECAKHVEEVLRSADRKQFSFACTILGGTDISLKPGSKGLAAFDETCVTVVAQPYQWKRQLADLVSLSIDGPGQTTSDAGVMGGGIGVEGAIVGVAIASALNALSRETEVNTILHLAWNQGELFLHTSRFAPEQGRVLLSRSFTAVKGAHANVGSDVASQLERISALQQAGALSAQEYQAAKSKILGSN